MKKNLIKYVLITPARNEADNIEKTINSVITQTHIPLMWVIVNDGSTDDTECIIKKYSVKLKWIKLITLPEHKDRQFAAKVNSFNNGLKHVFGLEYEIIGNVDADISFEQDYMEFIMIKFMEIPRLGVAGTPFIEKSYSSYQGKYVNFQHVSGACQMFRKKCFEEIGGYQPIRGGGIDWVAVTTARMKGWKTQTFPEKNFFHHRPMGTGNSGFLLSRFKHGIKDYYLGNHPLWEVFRTFHQMTKPPYGIAGLMLLFGYCFAAIKKIDCPMSNELLLFHRKEQMERLWGAVSGLLKIKKTRKKEGYLEATDVPN